VGLSAFARAVSDFVDVVVDHDAAKARADRVWAKRRQLARYEAFQHFKGCCAHCGVPLKLLVSQARHEFEIAHAHEEPPRSLGGDPLDPHCIVIVCYKCHGMATHGSPRLIIIIGDPSRGTFGPLSFRLRRLSHGETLDAHRSSEG
jgi:hypothetical protein